MTPDPEAAERGEVYSFWHCAKCGHLNHQPPAKPLCEQCTAPAGVGSAITNHAPAPVAEGEPLSQEEWEDAYEQVCQANDALRRERDTARQRLADAERENKELRGSVPKFVEPDTDMETP